MWKIDNDKFDCVRSVFHEIQFLHSFFSNDSIDKKSIEIQLLKIENPRINRQCPAKSVSEYDRFKRSFQAIYISMPLS